MTQVWLTLVAIFFAYLGVNARPSNQDNYMVSGVFMLLAIIFVVLSFVLCFYNGGTTG